MALVKEWECPDCGLVIEDDVPPDLCPSCGERGDLFECYEYECECDDAWDEEDAEAWDDDAQADTLDFFSADELASLIAEDWGIDGEPPEDLAWRGLEAGTAPKPPLPRRPPFAPPPTHA